MSGSPRQNRVDPYGRIVAVASRGLLMGNRGGRLHDSAGAIVRDQAGRAWITCRTAFRGRWRQVGATGYTELFFLDEATALSAGHRPCFECRRTDALRFIELHRRAAGTSKAFAADLDAALAHERRETRSRPGTGKRAFLAALADLPDGTVVDVGGAPHLLLAGAMRPWTHDGYRPALRLADRGWVLTPPSTVAVLRLGYRPQLHPTASPPAA